MLKSHLAAIHLGPGVDDGRDVYIRPAPSCGGKCRAARVIKTTPIPEEYIIADDAAFRPTINVEGYRVECICAWAGSIGE
jgi:hypothetical protein